MKERRIKRKEVLKRREIMMRAKEKKKKIYETKMYIKRKKPKN